MPQKLGSQKMYNINMPTVYKRICIGVSFIVILSDLSILQSVDRMFFFEGSDIRVH